MKFFESCLHSALHSSICSLWWPKTTLCFQFSHPKTKTELYLSFLEVSSGGASPERAASVNNFGWLLWWHPVFLCTSSHTLVGQFSVLSSIMWNIDARSLMSIKNWHIINIWNTFDFLKSECIALSFEFIYFTRPCVWRNSINSFSRPQTLHWK